MSDESNAPADLSNLGIDLSQMFRPSWTTETTGASDATAKLAAKFDEGDRPARGDRHDRDGRQGGRGPRREGPRTAGPRGPGGQGGQGGGNRDRGPRPEGRRDGKGGGPRREGGGRGREDRRGSQDYRDRASERAPQPVLEGWKLSIIPEEVAIEGIAKQVRSRAKAYPLFELARLILQLSDRYNVKLTPESEQTPGFFRAKTDLSLWTSRKDAVNHLLAKHLGKFYRKSTIATEPPKGAFTVVAQCGMSGVLLGPPNHHEYTSRIISLHASRFRNMPFEVYKSRIRMVRDEALIEQWKTEQSTKTVYIPLTPGDENATEATIVPAEAPAAETESPEVVAGAEIAEAPATEPAEAVAPEVDASTEVATEATADTTEGSEAPAATEEEAAPAAPAAEKSEEGGLTLEEATAHFQEHHAANEVESIEGEITLSGRSALHESTHLLRELLLQNLREMDRFPLPLAQAIGKELTGRGLQIFKSHKKIIHVSMARPRYLDRETTPIGESFRAILEYLEAHPNQRRDKQWTALLALRTETAESATDTAAPLVVAPVTEAPTATEETAPPAAASETPAPEASLTSDDETMKKREQALGTDLLWLLHQGHVLDFAMGNLQAATRPAPKQAPKPSKKEAAATAESTGEEVVAPEEESPVTEADLIAEQAAEEATKEAPAASAEQEPSKE
jgi:hypothetical protein